MQPHDLQTNLSLKKHGDKPRLAPYTRLPSIFYDAGENTVEVLAIIKKSEATRWLEEVGE